MDSEKLHLPSSFLSCPIPCKWQWTPPSSLCWHKHGWPHEAEPNRPFLLTGPEWKPRLGWLKEVLLEERCWDVPPGRGMCHRPAWEPGCGCQSSLRAETAPQAWNVLKGLCRGNIAFLPPPQSVRVSLSGFVKEAWFPSNNFFRIKRICTHSICPTLSRWESWRLSINLTRVWLVWLSWIQTKKKNKGWHFQTAPIPKHRGTTRLVWNRNKTFLGKVCISGPVYCLAGINGHVPSGLVVVSNLTQWVKPRFGQSLIAV